MDTNLEKINKTNKQDLPKVILTKVETAPKTKVNTIVLITYGSCYISTMQKS